jgi:hypothetical protein
MKIGLIVESGPQGAESQVLPKLIAKLGHDYQVPQPATFRNAPDLKANCGPAAARFVAEGCKKVMIVWDLYPSWAEEGKKGVKPCRHEDKEAIRKSLRAAGVADGRVSLVCIEEELEAWLIADGRALAAVLSTQAHPIGRVKDHRSPDDVHNPKKYLRRLFKQSGRGDYSDRVHAAKIVDAMPDLNKLRRSESFSRFASILDL